MLPPSSAPPVEKLLTIVVPTYNRADMVERLLKGLKQELLDLGDDVDVLVSDNASTDRTAEVVGRIASDWPALLTQRHPENIGADNNFCGCVERVTTRYFWIIGDDDLPKRGVIAGVVELLRTTSPALIYMDSEWVPAITGLDQGSQVAQIHAEFMDALAFARRVHVWFTFLSSVIVDRSRLLETAGLPAIRRFSGTCVVQLGWVLPLLKVGAPFVFIRDQCVLATKDNSGGYPLLTVLGLNFARVVRDVLGVDSPIGKALLNGNFLRFLPGLVWRSRAGDFKQHHSENPWPQMRVELGHMPIFWILLLPIGRAPHVLSQLVYQSWRVFNRGTRDLGRLLARLSPRPRRIPLTGRSPRR